MEHKHFKCYKCHFHNNFYLPIQIKGKKCRRCHIFNYFIFFKKKKRNNNNGLNNNITNQQIKDKTFLLSNILSNNALERLDTNNNGIIPNNQKEHNRNIEYQNNIINRQINFSLYNNDFNDNNDYNNDNDNNNDNDYDNYNDNDNNYDYDIDYDKAIVYDDDNVNNYDNNIDLPIKKIIIKMKRPLMNLFLCLITNLHLLHRKQNILIMFLKKKKI